MDHLHPWMMKAMVKLLDPTYYSHSRQTSMLPKYAPCQIICPPPSHPNQTKLTFEHIHLANNLDNIYLLRNHFHRPSSQHDHPNKLFVLKILSAFKIPTISSRFKKLEPTWTFMAMMRR